MSIVRPTFNRSEITHAADAEIVGVPTAKVRLLVDSSATGGALSTGTEIVGAEAGHVIAVPPRMPHAFSTQVWHRRRRRVTPRDSGGQARKA
jgi:hypothetical protein